MRRHHGLSPMLVLMAMGILGVAALGRTLAGEQPQRAGSHGTAVNLNRAWEAVHKAKQEKKLLMLVHVSGIFEDPTFT